MLKLSKVILNYKFVYHRKKKDFIVYVIGCVSVESLTSWKKVYRSFPFGPFV